MAKTPLQASSHHVVPTFTYVKTLIALAALMALTIFVSFVNLPGVGFISGTVINQTIALVIACVKAFLVIWVFMGIRYGTVLTRIWAAIGFVWFFLFFIMFGDYTTRQFEEVKGWQKDPITGKYPEGGALPRTPASASDKIEQPRSEEIGMRVRQ